MLGRVPRGALVLTAGVDVQRDRLEVRVWGWARKLESWLVDVRILDGDPTKDETWEPLADMLGETWPHEGGARMALAKLAVDAGDGLTTQSVYAWGRRMGHAQVYVVKGRDGFDRAVPVQGPTYVDVTEGGAKIRRGARLWTVAVATFKSELYRWLRLARPTDETLAEGGNWPGGYVHLPAGVTEEELKQLTAERLVTVKGPRGFPKLEWVKGRDRNEALDCRVYARAAAWLMGADRWEEHKWAELESQLRPGGSAPETPAGQPNRRGPAPPPQPSVGEWLGDVPDNWVEGG